MILYLDASSVIKLYVIEPPLAEAGRTAGWETEEVRRLFGQADNVFTSRVTYAEARAALARRLRENYFANPEDYSDAVRDLNRDWRTRMLKVGLSESLVRQAGALAEQHALRGYDAVHLASVLLLQQRIGSQLNLSTWDRDLSQAASVAGVPLVHQETTP